MLHPRGNQLSHILRDENDAHILRGLGFVQRLINLRRRASYAPAYTGERKAEHCVGMTDYKYFHGFLAEQHEEGDEQTVDRDAFRKTHEDQ